MNQLRLHFQKGDIIAVALVLVLAIAVTLLHFPRQESGETTVQIYQDGNLLQEVPLGQDKQIRVEGAYVNRIIIQNKAVFITDSDCPGRDCVHSGVIDSPGRSIVCLPNRVEVRIVSITPDVDFVVG